MIEWAQMATIISKKARKNHYHQYKRSLIILRVQVRRNKWPKNWREWKWTEALDLIWHIYRIKQYLSNTIQFSVKPNLTLITNQYTSGNEFTVKQDNSDYIGSYHIMADGTIMDGADMPQTTNKTLLAGNVLVQNRINTLIKEELGKLGAA